MGNGRLLQGVGLGEATVFNPNQAIQQFGNILAQQKAEKQTRDQALINQMTSLKSDAIRDADKADYLAKYNDWKQAAINANNIPKNSRERLDAIADAQAKYNSLGEFIGGSKEQKSHENQLANMWLSNGHLFDDPSHQKFIKSMQSPMSTSDFIPHTKYGDFERYVDPQKINTLLDAGKKKSLDDIIPERVQEKNYVQGDKRGVLVRNVKNIPYEKVAENYLHLAAINPDFKKYLNDQYKDVKGEDERSTLAARIHQLASDRGELEGWKHSDVAQFKPNDDSFAKHIRNREYDINHPTGTSSQLTPAQILIGGTPDKQVTGVLQGDANAAKRLLDLTPKAQYGGKQPEFTVDPNTGEHVFTFPAQLVKDEAAIKDNKKLRDEYVPAKENKTLGLFGGTPIPFERSEDFKKLRPEQKEKKAAIAYRIDPTDPQGYFGQVEQMGNDQNINFTKLNQTLGNKGHGIIPTAKTKPSKSKIKLSKGSLNDL